MANAPPFRPMPVHKSTRRLRPQADPFLLPAELAKPVSQTPSPPARSAARRPPFAAPPFVPQAVASPPAARKPQTQPGETDRAGATHAPDDRVRERAMGEIVSTLQTMNKTLEDYIRTARPPRAASPTAPAPAPAPSPAAIPAERAMSPPPRSMSRDAPHLRQRLASPAGVPADGTMLQMVAVRKLRAARRDVVSEVVRWLAVVVEDVADVDLWRGCCHGVDDAVAGVCNSVGGLMSSVGKRFGL